MGCGWQKWWRVDERRALRAAIVDFTAQFAAPARWFLHGPPRALRPRRAPTLAEFAKYQPEAAAMWTPEAWHRMLNPKP